MSKYMKKSLRNGERPALGSTVNTGTRAMTSLAKEDAGWTASNSTKEYESQNSQKGPLGGKHTGS